MFRIVARSLIIAFALAPAAVVAEPIKLKLAYFSSDRSTTYLGGIKPFVDAVNGDASNLVQIEVAFSGTLGRDPAKQIDLVRDGTADIAFIIPGYTPALFPDEAVIELPGLFNGIREATATYNVLMAGHALRGYDDLFVIGAYATDPETIHTRPPVRSIADLKGLRIRVNNPPQGRALSALGIVPVQMPINQAAMAIGSEKLDGSTAGPAPLVEFGIARVASNHFLLKVSAVPLVLAMNRKRFDALPAPAQAVIRRFSGDWAAERYVDVFLARNSEAIESLRRDDKRTVVQPSAADLQQAGLSFHAEMTNWAQSEPRHAELLAKVQGALGQLRKESVGQR